MSTPAATVSAQSLLAALPPARGTEPVAATAKIVVLDDDPTGTQTVHGVAVLTHWGVDALADELNAPGNCCYVLTNSRALRPAGAAQLAHEIGSNLREAAARAGRDFRIVSRSDSTLRGHFPVETQALAAGLGVEFDATLLVPAFMAGGRWTVDDVHYVVAGDVATPAHLTEFARDADFGYQHSDLRDWVEEKTGGKVRAGDVVSIPLQDLRTAAPEVVARRLLAIRRGGIGIVNAAARSDLAALTHALAHAEARGKRYLFRTAADFVAAYAAISPRALLEGHDLRRGNGPGLLVVGSYVGKTSGQLEILLRERPDLRALELDVPRILSSADRQDEVARARCAVTAALREGRDVVLYTGRQLVPGGVGVGAVVSAALVEIVATLEVRPSWLIAKGGITSSDIATRALGVRRALVLGQALPGVPVWQTGAESRWPELPYVVFPGNVGGPPDLAALVKRCAVQRSA